MGPATPGLGGEAEVPRRLPQSAHESPSLRLKLLGPADQGPPACCRQFQSS